MELFHYNLNKYSDEYNSLDDVVLLKDDADEDNNLDDLTNITDIKGHPFKYFNVHLFVPRAGF